MGQSVRLVNFASAMDARAYLRFNEPVIIMQLIILVAKGAVVRDASILPKMGVSMQSIGQEKKMKTCYAVKKDDVTIKRVSVFKCTTGGSVRV